MNTTMAGEVVFRNPLKKYLDLPIYAIGSACSHHREPKIYEVLRNHGRHGIYAIDAHKEMSEDDTKDAVDIIGNLLKSLPVLPFGNKMAEFLEGTGFYQFDKPSEDRQRFEDSTRHHFAVERWNYVQMFHTGTLPENGSGKHVIADLIYPSSAFGTVDVAASALTDNLVTPGWKEVSLGRCYGPKRFYIKNATAAKKSFKEVFAEWLESHNIQDLAAFDGSAGFFIYYDPVTQEFKGVHSLDYPEPTVLDLDSGELHKVVNLDDEIRLLPDELRGTFEPVVAARLTEDISTERFAQLLGSIEKTKKMNVMGCKDGVLLVSPNLVPKKDVSRAFCDATSCLGKCSLKSDSR